MIYAGTVKVSTVNITPLAISLSWEFIANSDGTATGYIISYTNKDKTCFDDSDTISVGSTVAHYTLNGLQENTTYVITMVILRNNSTISADIIEATTLPAGKCISIVFHESLSLKIIFPVPSAAPSSVSVSDMTASSITVQWSAVDCIHHNGDILGYSVRYGRVGSESTHTFNVSWSDKSAVNILDLMSGTTYKVDVATFNAVGTGNFSKKILVMTLAEGQLVISESVDTNSYNNISTEENGNSVGAIGLIAGVIFGVVVLVVIFIIIVLLIR